MAEHSIRVVKKAHIKLVGIGSDSLKRYRTAVSKFFAWRKNSGIRPSTCFAELDNQAGEYLNDLYQTDSPQHWAADFLSGLKKIYPRTRGNLKISESYYKKCGKDL